MDKEESVMVQDILSRVVPSNTDESEYSDRMRKLGWYVLGEGANAVAFGHDLWPNVAVKLAWAADENYPEFVKAVMGNFFHIETRPFLPEFYHVEPVGDPKNPWARLFIMERLGTTVGARFRHDFVVDEEDQRQARSVYDMVWDLCLTTDSKSTWRPNYNTDKLFPLFFRKIGATPEFIRAYRDVCAWASAHNYHLDIHANNIGYRLTDNSLVIFDPV